MRKMMAVTAMVLGLGIAALPAAGDDGDSYDRDEYLQEACETMAWQFGGARASRQTNPNFSRAVILGEQGVTKCDYGHHDDGAALLRTALQMIGVHPLY